MPILYLDIETNLAHSAVWCAGYAVDDGEPLITTSPHEVQGLIADASFIVGHNIIGFDAPVIERVWGVQVPTKKMVDTLVLSRLVDPSIDGGHSLAAWGVRLLMPKGDFTDYDSGYSEEMAAYCKQDIRVTRALHKRLVRELDSKDFSLECRELERQVAVVIEQQQRHGFCYDIVKGIALADKCAARMLELESYFATRFPAREVQAYSVATRRALKPYEEAFNIGSRVQIAEKLCEAGHGAKLSKRTPGGRYKMDEETLAGIDCEEARLLEEFLTIQKRSSQIAQWHKYVKPTGRIHGRVITNGAVTGRMTHQAPNMAQVPSCGGYMGTECRGLFHAEFGKKLVGIDASSLELRMLAHYMKDADYTKAVVEGSSKLGTDVHTRNQLSAGLSTRDQAKTFIYAFLYGAGAGKIGEIVGGGAAEGGKLINSFMKSTPALQALKNKVDQLAARGFIKGLDGRMLNIRSQHSALNTLLQGAGAIVMKKALVILYLKIREAKLDAKFVVNVHDEWQLECAEQEAERVGEMGVLSIKEAGEYYKMRCPLDGEYKVGSTWADTH